MDKSPKKEISFQIYSSGGNLTAIVPGGKYKNLGNTARKIMRAYRRIEQVCFLEAPILPGCDLHLQMMGGEFCGNAARSAAMYIARVKGKKQVRLTVSGFALPVAARISSDVVSLNLPAKFLRKIFKVREGWLIDFEGIRFLVCFKKINKHRIPQIINQYKDNFAAVGVVMLSKIRAGYKISPWVWVRATKTLIVETACASGSLAAAAVLHQMDASKKLYKIKQPSGSWYKVGVIGKLGSIKKFFLSGSVKIIL